MAASSIVRRAMEAAARQGQTPGQVPDQTPSQASGQGHARERGQDLEQAPGQGQASAKGPKGAPGLAGWTRARLGGGRSRARATPAFGARRWAWAGALGGALLALLMFAPAAWVASAVSRASGGHLMLAEARGSWWQGDAVVVLSGGPGSREAWTLPGRIGWTLGLQGLQPVLTLRQPCCLAGEMALRLEPGIGRVGMALMPSTSGGSPPANVPAAAPTTAPTTAPASPAASPGTIGPAQAIGQWPAAWLTALGTPWNTLKPAGLVRLSAQRLRIERAEGRWRLSGSLAADFVAMSSSLSTLPSLGSYRVEVSGDAAGVASLALRTVEGPLLLSGQGQWTGGRLRLRGEARAAAGQEAALNNLLNLIGRRQGERALIAIG